MISVEKQDRDKKMPQKYSPNKFLTNSQGMLHMRHLINNQSMKELQLDMWNLQEVLVIIINTYHMPGRVHTFACSLQEELNMQSRGYRDKNANLQTLRCTSLQFLKSGDTYNPLLKEFFQSSVKTAPWWEYYISSYQKMEKHIVNMLRRPYGIYYSQNDQSDEPIEHPDVVDKKFEWNKNFRMASCNECRHYVGVLLTIPTGEPETYPAVVSIVSAKRRFVVVCSLQCYNLTRQKELTFKYDQQLQIKVKSVGKTVRIDKKCDVCSKEQSAHVTLQRCSKCGNKYYCSQQCQVNDWRKHRVICNNTNFYATLSNAPKRKNRQSRGGCVISFH